jgi:hypothetical protein
MSSSQGELQNRAEAIEHVFTGSAGHRTKATRVQSPLRALQLGPVGSSLALHSAVQPQGSDSSFRTVFYDIRPGCL